MREVWKSVVSYPTYLVSNLGRVKRAKPTHCDKNGVMYKRKSLLLKGTIDKDGYLKVHLSCKISGLSKVNFVHRLVAIAFIGNPDRKRTVNHKDGIKLNNRLDNLEWATDKENVTHSFKHGFSTNKGIKNSQCKLNNEDALEIKRLRGILPQSLVAEMFGISHGHVSNIQRGYNWSHL